MMTLIVVSMGGLFTSQSVEATRTVEGPFYTTFTGAELTSSYYGTLARRCESAVEDYGSTIRSDSKYTCQWYNRIDRGRSSTIGVIIDVTYSPYYIYY